MAPSESLNVRPKPLKLPRLPSNARITKRPLLRPPIPSPYASSASPKIIYISAKTPFISAVKRVRKLLDLIDKKAVGKVDLGDGRKGKETLRALGEVDQASGKEPEEVILKATNRAIEKALGLGVFFQGQGDVRVRLRTGSVGAVDDIVIEEKRTARKGKKGSPGRNNEEGATAGAGENAEDGNDEVNEEMGNVEADDAVLPETQIRRVSVLEVGISLK
ncbi:MAG: hypothetical protein L6R42_000449 [Xanthoria sp. 1 TBL-2021]|nr:MAG: hypothetical protein L6R42_000449 [Xanthoria sp. 1 TBL-2021]